MLVNSCVTVFHKSFDEEKRIEKWIRYNYGDNTTPKVWFYGGKGVSTNKGYENSNDAKVRIPYDINFDLDINNFGVGDILVHGFVDIDINIQQDLLDYEVYNITSIINNISSINKHIHLEGK